MSTETAPTFVVLVDGRSGAGKSTFVRELIDRLPDPVQLLALDDFYPGWDGLRAAVHGVHRRILLPYARGEYGAVRRWDWDADAYAQERTVDPARPLIVEGAGIITPATSAVSNARIWLESPETSRRARALARDGDLYRPHWERWARQEREHLLRDRPRALATHTYAIP